MEPLLTGRTLQIGVFRPSNRVGSISVLKKLSELAEDTSLAKSRLLARLCSWITVPLNRPGVRLRLGRNHNAQPAFWLPHDKPFYFLAKHRKTFPQPVRYLLKNQLPDSMNPNDTNDYNPAEDENQGIVTKLVQGEEANNGISQIEYMSPVFNQGPESVKEEVNNNDSDTESSGVNDDVLAEEAVEDGDVEVENE